MKTTSPWLDSNTEPEARAALHCSFSVSILVNSEESEVWWDRAELELVTLLWWTSHPPRNTDATRGLWKAARLNGKSKFLTKILNAQFFVLMLCCVVGPSSSHSHSQCSGGVVVVVRSQTWSDNHRTFPGQNFHSNNEGQGRVWYFTYYWVTSTTSRPSCVVYRIINSKPEEEVGCENLVFTVVSCVISVGSVWVWAWSFLAIFKSSQLSRFNFLNKIIQFSILMGS